jgi:hypothetical protein
LDARRFDTITRQLSRRGLGALLGAALLTGATVPAQAKVGRCGGKPNFFTKHCKNAAGSCETDADCAVGCTCVEQRQGCCYTVRRRKKRGKRRKVRRCVDGRPGLYCMPR